MCARLPLLAAIEHRLLQAGMHPSWSTLREHLSTHQVVTVVLHEAGSRRILKIRKATNREDVHREIYATLRIPAEVIKPIKTWEVETSSQVIENTASATQGCVKVSEL